MRRYIPRGMPRRFMDGAPEIVRRNVVDLIAIVPAAPLDLDVIFRQIPLGDSPPEFDTDADTSYGLDFGTGGERGCHFWLRDHEMRAYRERNRRRRLAWRDLPPATQQAIVAYLEL